jgi:hypothetical protein
MQSELQEIRDIVTGTVLPAKVQQTILTRFDELPSLYAELNRTYESRFSDRIAGSVASMVRLLNAKEAGPDAPQLAATIVSRMRVMHDRHGIAVILKPPPAVKQPRKKVSG